MVLIGGEAGVLSYWLDKRPLTFSIMCWEGGSEDLFGRRDLCPGLHRAMMEYVDVVPLYIYSRF